jgi:hypothetical protein
MANRLHHVNTMAARERMAILLLPGANGAEADHDLLRQFELLRMGARSSGLFILKPSSRFVGIDELKLIAWLTLLQRRAIDVVIHAPEELNDLIRSCAIALDSSGIRLNYSNVLRGGDNGLALPAVGHLREEVTQHRISPYRYEDASCV